MPTALLSKTDNGENVAALERGFRVLDCFVQSNRPLSNSEVAAATGIPRPSVTRLIGTLVSLGHLRLSEGQEDRWVLAAGVVRLAEAFLGSIDIRAHARPHVVRLAEELGVSSFLGVRDGLDALVVEAGRARSAVAVMGADVGTRMRLVTSALGRAWLAGVDEPTRDAVRRQLLRARTPAAELDAMDRAVDAARKVGYVVSLGEWHPNVNAVAVPVRTAAGQVVAINCGGPSFLLGPERLVSDAVPRILAAAKALARDIGGSAGVWPGAISNAHPIQGAEPEGEKPPTRPRRLKSAKSFA